jgi:hypothetical protein
LRARESSVKRDFVAAPKRKTKGRRHHVHAESLEKIAEALATASGDAILPTLTNAQLLTVIAHIFKKEHDRVTAIVR